MTTSDGPAEPGRLRSLLTLPFRRPVRFAAALALLAAGWFAASWLWLEADVRRAAASVAAGHDHRAIRVLNSLRTRAPDDPRVLLLSARVARRTGRFDQAGQLLDDYWRRSGDTDALVLERLLLRASRGEADTVAVVLDNRLAAGDPASEAIYEALVLGALQRFQLNRAEAAAARWREAFPQSAQALMLDGRVRELSEDTAKAIECYRAALALDPQHDDARGRLADQLVKQTSGPEALAHLDYLRDTPAWGPGLETARALALELVGRTAEAVVALDALLARDPNNAAALAERGRLARADGDNATAEDMLARAAEADPGNVQVRYQYYRVLKANRRDDAAQKELDRIHLLEEDLKRMRTLINEKLRTDPANPDVFYEIAMISLRAGLPRETLRWLQAAAAVAPDHLRTHLALATYYQKTNNPVLSGRHRSIAAQLAKKQGAAAPDGTGKE